MLCQINGNEVESKRTIGVPLFNLPELVPQKDGITQQVFIRFKWGKPSTETRNAKELGRVTVFDFLQENGAMTSATGAQCYQQ